MKEALISLLEVRKLISLAITILFIVLAVTGQIDSKLVEYVTTSVIAYYFAKSTALDNPNGNNAQ
jgi:hypothetical protein